MKKENLTTRLRPEYKKNLAELAKVKGLSLGQTIEFLLDQYFENQASK